MHGDIGKLTAACVLLIAVRSAVGGKCIGGDPPCADCPCLESCYRDEDCPNGQMCVPDCLPSACICFSDGSWKTTSDCAGRCIVPPVPDGPPTYTIVELPALYFEAHANAINNLGQVVGSYSPWNQRSRADRRPG